MLSIVAQWFSEAESVVVFWNAFPFTVVEGLEAVAPASASEVARYQRDLGLADRKEQK